jgi:hypothetical protein
MRSRAESRAFVTTAAWMLAAVALLAVRLPHLGGPLDDPHSWRQCDTAFYSLDFLRRGIDLFHPSVCWLGAHRTLIFEFPLPEAMSAMLYRAFGPDPFWDRLVALGFFVVSAAYLRAFTGLIVERRVSWLVTLAYLAFPLGQFYSRAAHVDFAALAFAHGFLYHAAVAVRGGSLGHAGLAAASGALAAMIKAPYLVPVLGPLALVVWDRRGPRSIALSGGALLAAGVAFVAWRRHVDAVNGAAPDWSFLPGFYKEVNPLWWYVGDLAQRLEIGNWIKLARRALFEILTPLGALLALLAWLPRGARNAGPGPLAVALAWTAATLLYLAVFFPLNVIHNYYQTPFLAPLALLVGLGGAAVWERLPRLGASRLPSGALAFAGFLVAAVLSVSSLGYYRVDWLRVEAGRLIAAETPRDDLVVVADHGSGYSDPRLLHRADRLGWPLAIADLDPDRLARLAGLGARWVAVVTDPEHPELAPPAFLERGSAGSWPVLHQGRSLGTLRLYHLGRALASASTQGPS